MLVFSGDEMTAHSYNIPANLVSSGFARISLRQDRATIDSLCDTGVSLYIELEFIGCYL